MSNTEYAVLITQNQHEGESVTQYLAAVRKFTERCDFNDFLNEVLHDKLVCGLQDEIFRENC